MNFRNYHNNERINLLGERPQSACRCSTPRPFQSQPSGAGKRPAADAPPWAWVEAAFSDENLLTYFQPIVHTVSGKTEGHETLMRSCMPSWQNHHGSRAEAVAGAGELIAACRSWNVLPWMDKRARLASVRAVAGAIARETKADDGGTATEQERYFINFLPSIVYNPAVCLQTTMAEAAKHNVPPARLVFEVSESEPIRNMAHLQNILAYYRAHGAQTAVDDLGMGFATADYLPLLRPDYLKISLEWLHRAEHDAPTRRELRDLIKAAHDLGTKIIAEGVETFAQHDLCLHLDADLVQGYLFGRPAPLPPTTAPF